VACFTGKILIDCPYYPLLDPNFTMKTVSFSIHRPLWVYSFVSLMLLVTSCRESRKETATSPTESKPSKEFPGMVWIPGGTFVMGTNEREAYSHEQPAHQVRVDGFWMDVAEVTNEEFQAFVEETGYITIAERKPEWEELKKQSPPGTPPPPDSLLVPGSLVFSPPGQPVMLNDYSQWWRWTPGANWRHPEGPGSNLEGRMNHPVVHVAYEDALSYCTSTWKRLPTEAEW